MRSTLLRSRSIFRLSGSRSSRAGRTRGNSSSAIAAIITATAAVSTTVAITAASAITAAIALNKRLHALFQSNDNATFTFFSNGIGGDTLNIRNRGMDNAALGGIHGVQGNRAAKLADPSCILTGNFAKSALSLLPIISNVDGDMNGFFLFVSAICCQTNQILDGVQRVSPTTNDQAVILLTENLEEEFLLVLEYIDFCVGNADFLDDLSKIRIGSADSLRAILKGDGLTDIFFRDIDMFGVLSRFWLILGSLFFQGRNNGLLFFLLLFGGSGLRSRFFLCSLFFWCR